VNNFFMRFKTFLKGNTVLRDAGRTVFLIFGRGRRKRTIAYLRKRCGHIINGCRTAAGRPCGDRAEIADSGSGNYRVWVCWLQGEENMPDLVKMCYASLLKNAGGRDVTLITFDNYTRFVDIPGYIVEKHGKGMIHNIQFSDIIRSFLLCAHGGLWIDATYYVSGGLPDFSGLEFYTPRWNRGSKKWPEMLYMESLLYCRRPQNALASFLRDIFTYYWKHENRLIDYLMLSASIECAYRDIPAVKSLMDAVPTAGQGAYDLYYSLNDPCDAAKYEALCGEIVFHKLTYKESFKKYTKDGKLTFYGRLWQEYERGG